MSHIMLKNWSIIRVERRYIENFIENWHYSGSINGCISDYCYALYDDREMKGAMFYGKMAMKDQWKRFSDSENKVIELRRLCCIDDTPKNTESFFIGKSLKLLRFDWGGETVVSYADKEYGHKGVIYKASNFEMVGEVEGAKVIIYKGKKYHDKTIRTEYNGKLKPFALKIKNALDSGEAYYKKTAGKFTYVYKLKPIKRHDFGQQTLF